MKLPSHLKMSLHYLVESQKVLFNNEVILAIRS